eukprot:TRINITY_DN12783_c0_g2_i2.p1 TRINITY_DN12783_c0_g2~~TRINITY_DN12783_c0_g2_i2.p1  ORF type:complete len:223 (+),score=1.29 TRINITY_DN12783_c0_g2_i2:614-1282(+)
MARNTSASIQALAVAALSAILVLATAARADGLRGGVLSRDDEASRHSVVKRSRGRALAFSTAATCSKSYLSGYTKKVVLTPGLIFHWKTNGSTIKAALQATASTGFHRGWFSVGWSTTGRMFPADAVVGNLPGVGSYAMTGYGDFQVAPTTSFKLKNTSVVTNAAQTVVRFTRSGLTGLSPIKYYWKNYLVWAASEDGMSKTLGNHGHFNCGSVVVNFACKV